MKYYTVHIPTKAYLKKYITTLEGSPLVMNSDSQFCVLLRLCLSNDVTSGLSGAHKQKRLESFTESLQVKLPISNMRRYGYSLSPDQIIILNRYLEKDFEKELVRFCQYSTIQDVRYSGYKKAYEDFSERFNIILEQDIQYDTLKKIEYRARLKTNKKCVQNVLSAEVTPSSLF